MGTNTDLYAQDFFQWTQTTAALSRQGKWPEVDACDEKGLPETAFPQECPWTAEPILADDFWPERALPV